MRCNENFCKLERILIAFAVYLKTHPEVIAKEIQ